MNNFRISGIVEDADHVRCMTIIKRSAAIANYNLDPKKMTSFAFMLNEVPAAFAFCSFPSTCKENLGVSKSFLLRNTTYTASIGLIMETDAGYRSNSSSIRGVPQEKTSGNSKVFTTG